MFRRDSGGMEIKDYGRKGLHGMEWHRIARVASIISVRRSRSQGLDLDWHGGRNVG